MWYNRLIFEKVAIAFLLHAHYILLCMNLPNPLIAMSEMVICLTLYFLGTQMNYKTFLYLQL